MAIEAYAILQEFDQQPSNPGRPFLRDESVIAAIQSELAEGGGPETLTLFEQAELAPPDIFVSPNAEDMGFGIFEFLLDHWRGLSADGGIPRAAALDPIDLRPALGYLTLLDVVDQGRDFRYRLYGSEVVTHTGFDLTGKRYTQIGGIDGSEGVVPTFFMAVNRYILGTGFPVFTVHQPCQHVTKYRWHRLALPLTNPDGEIIRIVNCVRPSDIESSRFDRPLRGSPM